MANLRIQLEPDDLSWDRFASALRSEADGRALRRDLARSWRVVGEEGAEAARRSIRHASMGRSRHAVSLREAIADGVAVHVSTAQVRPGVTIAWHRRGMKKAVRGKFGGADSILWRAGVLLNNGTRWGHPVFGRGYVVTGVPGARGWFHAPLRRRMPAMEEAVRQAYRDVVDRIRARSEH